MMTGDRCKVIGQLISIFPSLRHSWRKSQTGSNILVAVQECSCAVWVHVFTNKKLIVIEILQPLSKGVYFFRVSVLQVCLWVMSCNHFIFLPWHWFPLRDSSWQYQHTRPSSVLLVQPGSGLSTMLPSVPQISLSLGALSQKSPGPCKCQRAALQSRQGPARTSVWQVDADGCLGAQSSEPSAVQLRVVSNHGSFSRFLRSKPEIKVSY